MKLVAYQINGQTIGIDIGVWNDAMLSGNTAFQAIADTGSTPTDYVDISSVDYWDKFGGLTTLDDIEIKSEIVKLIPDTPTPEQYEILENYATVGLDSLTNIDGGVTLGSVLGNGTYLTGVTDTKMATSGDTTSTLKVWEITGDTGKFDSVLRINGKFYAEWIKNIRTASRALVTRYDDTDALTNDNISGVVVLNPSGGTAFTGGSATEYWFGVNNKGVFHAGWEDEEKPIYTGAGGKIQLVDSVGGQQINPAATTAITWGQTDFKDTDVFTFTNGNSSITVLEDGVYELSFNVNGAGETNARAIPGIQFRNNSTPIAPTLTSDYGRNTSNNDTNNTLPPYLITLSANDVLDVVAFRLGDSNGVLSKAGASFVRVTYLG